MKRTMGIVAASIVLSGSAVALTATTSSAATTFGPYSNLTTCQKARANTKAMAGQKVSACRYSKVDGGYVFTVG